MHILPSSSKHLFLSKRKREHHFPWKRKREDLQCCADWCLAIPLFFLAQIPPNDFKYYEFDISEKSHVHSPQNSNDSILIELYSFCYPMMSHNYMKSWIVFVLFAFTSMDAKHNGFYLYSRLKMACFFQYPSIKLCAPYSLTCSTFPWALPPPPLLEFSASIGRYMPKKFFFGFLVHKLSF